MAVVTAAIGKGRNAMQIGKSAMQSTTGLPKVLVTATYIVTSPNFNSGGTAVFSVWANNPQNVVGQIVVDGSKKDGEYTLTPDGKPLDLTNLPARIIHEPSSEHDAKNRLQAI
jgi:hypothetical protein